MSLFGDSQSGDFLFLPKKNTEITVTILGEVKRVDSTNIKLNYKKQGAVDCGYYDTMDVVNEENGEQKVLLIGTWVFYFLLKEREDLDVGDTITIAHAGVGEYTIVKK